MPTFSANYANHGPLVVPTLVKQLEITERPSSPGKANSPTAGSWEIEVRGPAVFIEYWGKPEETRKSFRDGWFLTGDVAVEEQGRFRILGRNSVDIIKTGGYKVSALEIEEVLRTHPQIEECAVVGMADPVWGERVCAAVVLKNRMELTIEALRNWGKEWLAPYKIPKDLLVVEELPRNAMGKVSKPGLKKVIESRQSREP